MSFGHTQFDQNAVSDLKTVRMPCCSKEQRRDFDNRTHWTYGEMVVDLNSSTGSLLGALLAFVIFCTKQEGYPLETRADDRCFFSPWEASNAIWASC